MVQPKQCKKWLGLCLTAKILFDRPFHLRFKKMTVRFWASHKKMCRKTKKIEEIFVSFSCGFLRSEFNIFIRAKAERKWAQFYRTYVPNAIIFPLCIAIYGSNVCVKQKGFTPRNDNNIGQRLKGEQDATKHSQTHINTHARTQTSWNVGW